MLSRRLTPAVTLARGVRREWVTQRRGIVGIRDRLQNFAEDKKEKQAREQFTKQMELMKSTSVFTLAHFRSVFDDALTKGEGWRGMMPGVRSSPELTAVKRTARILDALTPEEKSSTGEHLKRREKLRVAETAECSVEDVNELLRQYDVMLNVHHWVRKRIEKGRPLPETQEELTQLLASDKEGLKRDFAMRMAKQSGSMAGMRHAKQRAGRKRRF